MRHLGRALRSHLPIRLELTNVAAVSTTGRFLGSCVGRFGRGFSLPVRNVGSIFRIRPRVRGVGLVLTILYREAMSAKRYLERSGGCCHVVSDENGRIRCQGKAGMVFVRTFSNDRCYYMGSGSVCTLRRVPRRRAGSGSLSVSCAPPGPGGPHVPPVGRP